VAGSGLLVRIDINGARPRTYYRISACANLGGQYSCTSDANSDVAMSDAFGGIHGSFATPAPVRTDLVTVANTADANDKYQAWFSGVTPFYTQAVMPATQVYSNGNGLVVVPAGAQVYPAGVCPRGFVGPLTVAVGPTAPYTGIYTYWTYYTWPYYQFPAVPAAMTTVTVYCNGF
jgi:hypothetical protein